MRAAAKRIVPLRRRMALEDAEDIVRMEFERQGIRLPPNSIRQHAKSLHTKPVSPLLHPIRARRAGWKWSWRGGPD
jgi:hypothetical protein